MTPERFAKLKAVLTQRQHDLTVFADGVHKPHNVSAILRTCDAVGIAHLHVVADDSEFRQHHMLAGGSKRWVDITTHESSEAGIAHLRTQGWQLAVADTSEAHTAERPVVDFRSVDYTRKIAIVMGAELDGPSETSKSAAELRISIPMHGLVESLNVSVATAVVLYEAQRQRVQAGLYDESRMPKLAYEKKLFEWAQPDIARRCRDKKLGYPALTEDGDLAENPFN